MKKVKTYKGFVIALDKECRFQLFLKSEWKMGKGFRSPEWDACTMKEAKEFIDCY